MLMEQDGLRALSPPSERMLDLKDLVLAQWEAAVRGTQGAPRTSHDYLASDTFSALYSEIAKSLTLKFDKASLNNAASAAGAHGIKRATQHDYSVSALVGEYQAFRRIIFDVLKHNFLPLDHAQGQGIHDFIDGAIKESVNAFASVRSAWGERVAVSMVHDMRGPIGTAMIGVELIAKHSDSQKTSDLAEKIAKCLAQLEEMTGTLLDSIVFPNGMRHSDKLENFNLQDLIFEIVEQLPTMQASRIKSTMLPTCGWWKRQSVRRAIDNLVDNAIKYGDPNKPISITLDHDEQFLMLSVHNKGNPIPLADQEKIFQIFKRMAGTNAEQKQGWGIGLPNVRSIAENHGGRVSVSSSARSGTSFTIYLPLDSRPYLLRQQQYA